MFDQLHQAKILKVVQVSCGGETGFDQAIELSSEILSNVKFIQEKRLIRKYFEISQDTGRFVYGEDRTLEALEMIDIEILIVLENLDITRYVLKKSITGEIVIKICQPIWRFWRMPLLEWFSKEYKRFGCSFHIVTNKSQEGSQFFREFGRIGGILRLQLPVFATRIDYRNPSKSPGEVAGAG